MRITFISPPVNFGGGTKVIVIYAQHLKRMGHTVRIVSPPPMKVSLLGKIKSWLNGNGWISDLSRSRSHLDGSGVDHHILDRYRAVTDDDVPDGDIVIATWWLTAEWLARLSARKGAKVYFIQGHEIHDHLPVSRSQATYRFAFHKIVIAQWLKQMMTEQYGDSLVDVVPNSVDRTQFFAPARGKQLVPTVGFLYAAGQVKGVESTLAALRIVRERIPGLHVISFGSQRQSPSLPLPKCVEFLHLPPQGEIRSLYARCDVWITASRSEGFNLPALEAMACRTPVVSTRTGWPEEAIQSGWNGILVDVDDVDGLAQAVEWVLTRSDDDWRTLSANAYATASAGSWLESAKLFETALEHARVRAERGEIMGCSG